MSNYTRRAEVYYAKLWELIPVYEMNVTGDQVEAIRNLHYAVGTEYMEVRYDRRRHYVDADKADVERWIAAAESIRREMTRVRAEEQAASKHLRPPYGTAERLVWRLRYANRNRRLRASYDATMDRLRREVLAAYQDYLDSAGDMTEYVVAAELRREEQRRAWEAQQRDARAAAIRDAREGRLWGYRLRQNPDGRRYFEIVLQPLLIGDVELERSELTTHEIEDALAQVRTEEPLTIVTWGVGVHMALREWHGGDSVGDAWEALTGNRLVEYPPGSLPKQSSAFRGVSHTNYVGPHL